MEENGYCTRRDLLGRKNCDLQGRKMLVEVVGGEVQYAASIIYGGVGEVEGAGAA